VPRTAVKSTRPDLLDIEFETFGSPTDPALLLIAGFIVQLTSWDTGFCELLAAGGRYVIRFDNRDCGLSTKLDGAPANWSAALQANMTGGPMPDVPYTLSDMAQDCVGLLDALDIDAAHVAGASMGGMIAQTMAIEHPGRVLSLGDPRVGKPAPEALDVLLTVPPTDRTAYVDAASRATVWASKRYVDVERIRRRAGESFDRSFYPEGGPRQLAAIYASGDRTAALQRVDVPALVIHGRDDTLITPEGGSATAAAIPRGHLLLVADMGHDLPPALWPLIASAILGFTAGS
jgi:pimeloyl-ACP methyl ester carboxylesterase